jgi:hypothetical protein
MDAWCGTGSAHDVPYTTPNLTIGASDGTPYAYRCGKAGTVPFVFLQLKVSWASMRQRSNKVP